MKNDYSNDEKVIHSEEVDDIIFAVPSWLLRSGITIILLVILGMLTISAFVSYPDVIHTPLVVNSLNAPKSVIAKQQGKLVTILVKDKQTVKKNQPLAFLESAANHRDVISVLQNLIYIRNEIQKNKYNKDILSPENRDLGELQSAYQSFYQSYILFLNTQEGGHYLKQKYFLKNDLTEINKLKENIIAQKKIRELELINSKQQYTAYKKLMSKSVISVNEFKEQENKYLSSQHPVQESEAELLNNNSAYLSKEKEILELDNIISDQKAKFIQALNAIISETETWIMKYVLTSPVQGTVAFAGIIQENQNVSPSEEIFIINPGNSTFFGKVYIPQYNMGKIQIGQNVLVKMQSFPFEQYGMIRGRLSYLSDVALKDSVFIAKIDFEKYENKDPRHKINLKSGMLADAEIITEESSLLQRITRNFTRIMNMN